MELGHLVPQEASRATTVVAKATTAAASVALVSAAASVDRVVAAAWVGRGEWTVREASTDRHHSPATETTTGVVTQRGRLLETLATGASNSETAVLTAEIREAQVSSKVVTKVVGRASAVMRLATGAVERILSDETRICRKAVHVVALTATVTGVATAWGRPPGLKMMPVLLDSAAQQPIGVVVPSPSARP